jgi:hypothetical protein
MRILIHGLAFVVSICFSFMLRVINGFWEYRVGAALTRWEINPFAFPFEIGSIVLVYVVTMRIFIGRLKCKKLSGKAQMLVVMIVSLAGGYIIMLSGQPLSFFDVCNGYQP